MLSIIQVGAVKCSFHYIDNELLESLMGFREVHYCAIVAHPT
jgi:hypothetical protein